MQDIPRSFWTILTLTLASISAYIIYLLPDSVLDMGSKRAIIFALLGAGAALPVTPMGVATVPDGHTAVPTATLTPLQQKAIVK